MQAVQAPSSGVPQKAIQGYAFEIYSTVDASQLPQGIVATGFPVPGGPGSLTQPGTGAAAPNYAPAAITDVWMAILMELRQMNVQLRAFNDGASFDTRLNIQS